MLDATLYPRGRESCTDNFSSLDQIYAENWDRILAVKRKYDPENRLKSQTGYIKF